MKLKIKMIRPYGLSEVTASWNTILQLYVYVLCYSNIYNMIFTIWHKSYTDSGSPPSPSHERFWVRTWVAEVQTSDMIIRRIDTRVSH